MDPTIFPDDLSGLSHEALSGLEAAAVAEFNALDGDDVSDEAIARLSALADGTDRIRTELATRTAVPAVDVTSLRSRMAFKQGPAGDGGTPAPDVETPDGKP